MPFEPTNLTNFPKVGAPPEIHRTPAPIPGSGGPAKPDRWEGAALPPGVPNNAPSAPWNKA